MTAPSRRGASACGSRSPSRSDCTSSMREAAKAREILDGIVQVYLPLPMRPSIVNVYLVRAGDRWTLIDTGMNTEDSVAAFRGALDEIGIDPQAIGRLVATHHHVDHFGTSGPYRELAHAEVYTHPLEAQAAVAIGQIPAENTAYLARHGVPVVPPDRRLPPPSRFFGTWYAPAEPDHLIADEDDRRRARQLIDFHRVRKLAMLELIRRRPLTAYEVALDAFAIAADNRFQVFMATVETLAHLELLRREGRALRHEQDGVVRYQGR